MQRKSKHTHLYHVQTLKLNLHCITFSGLYNLYILNIYSLFVVYLSVNRRNAVDGGLQAEGSTCVQQIVP